MSEIIKVPISDLKEGMIVVKFNKGGFSFPHYGHPFPDALLKKYLIRNGVVYAYIKKPISDLQKDEIKRVLTPPPPPPEPIRILSQQQSFMDINLDEIREDASSEILPTIKEINKAMAVHRHSKEVVKDVLLDVRLGNVVDTKVANNTIIDLVDQCINSPGAFVNMTRLKDFDDYTFTHSVNVAVIAIAIGRRLGASAQDMNKLGFAGLFHDIGKMMIPDKLINKPGRLTQKEYSIVKRHALLGYNYLKKDSSIPDSVLQAVKHHHEKADGTGYPDGLTDTQIHKYAKIISVADVYDAVTTERSYHAGMIPSDALKMIFSWSGKHFNQALVKFFISIMGIYPVGTLVILDTNELAVILEPNKSDPIRPRILVISDNRMEPAPPRYFDLSSYNVVSMTPYKTIISALDPKEFSIDTNKLIGQYIKANSNRATVFL